MTEPKKLSLVRKLAEVMIAASNVPKGGHNKAQGYDFARDVDVLDAVRLELAKRNVILTNTAEETSRSQVETRSGAKMQHVAVRMSFTAHDGDSGEALPFSVGLGEAMDSGDKSVYKAETGATKYGILKGFLIPTREDAEGDESVDHATSAPSATLPAPARQAAPPAQHRPAASGLPDTFPGFGSQKGKPIATADAKNLSWYLKCSKENLANPEKERWHDKERSYIQAYEAALLRLNRGQPPPSDDAYGESLQNGDSEPF